ncbi:Histone_H3 [Hexamita inflata]|uniref:Histone H3 n=1 Tax=Hexamita inflata TaxID=28002 RepID=A0AA86TM70_9EUKA|nr:Histone H3 [Hexamita inflata]
MSEVEVILFCAYGLSYLLLFIFLTLTQYTSPLISGATLDYKNFVQIKSKDVQLLKTHVFQLILRYKRDLKICDSHICDSYICESQMPRITLVALKQQMSTPDKRMSRVKFFNVNVVRKTKAKKSMVVKRASVVHHPLKHIPKRVAPVMDGSKKQKKVSSSIEYCIPSSSFAKLVREVAVNIGLQYRFQRTAIETLQHAAESIMIEILGDSHLIAQHSGRVTTKGDDMRLQMRIAKQSWASNW